MKDSYNHNLADSFHNVDLINELSWVLGKEREKSQKRKGWELHLLVDKPFRPLLLVSEGINFESWLFFCWTALYSIDYQVRKDYCTIEKEKRKQKRKESYWNTGKKKVGILNVPGVNNLYNKGSPNIVKSAFHHYRTNLASKQCGGTIDLGWRQA